MKSKTGGKKDSEFQDGKSRALDQVQDASQHRAHLSRPWEASPAYLEEQEIRIWGFWLSRGSQALGKPVTTSLFPSWIKVGLQVRWPSQIWLVLSPSLWCLT